MPKLRSERVSARRALPRGQAMATDDDDSGSAPAGPAEEVEGGEEAVVNGGNESVIASGELTSMASATDGDDGAAAAVLDFPALSAKELSVSAAFPRGGGVAGAQCLRGPSPTHSHVNRCSPLLALRLPTCDIGVGIWQRRTFSACWRALMCLMRGPPRACCSIRGCGHFRFCCVAFFVACASGDARQCLRVLKTPAVCVC